MSDSADWNSIAMKRLLSFGNGRDHKSIEVDEPGFPVYGSGGRFAFASDYLHDGESVLFGRKGTVDKPLYVNERFWTVDTMYYTKIEPTCHARFLYYAALTIPFDMYSTNTALPSITQETLGKHKLLRPPLPEQKQIAAFLDYETAKIDALIAMQQQLIALLGEKRQAVISHAVTKGLNPDAPMRDSGIEWLGEVPEHWTVCALGKVTLDKCDGPFGSGLKSEHYRETGVRVIRLQNIKMNRYLEGQGAFIDQIYYDQKLSDHSVVAGDLLIAGLGDANNPVGRACVAPAGIEPAMVKADCFRYRVDSQKVNSEFLAFQLSASAGFASGTLSSGSTRSRIPLSVTASRYVAFSSLEEQASIVAYVQRMRDVYSRLEECASTMVDRLQERRTALISAAVTGKIDVRGWKPPSSARMPETEMEVA